MTQISRTQRRQLFRDILKGVSRSFYLTLRVLPDAVREPIALAYLLARAADTLADTTVLPESERLNYLHCFQGYMTAPESTVGCEEIQGALKGELGNPDEARLLGLLPELFTLLAALDAEDQQRVRQVVETLCSGMVFDLQTFPNEESGELCALQKFADMDRYTYMVAGCVGEFWTEMIMAHTPKLSHWDKAHYAELGIQFGKALQYTNILRDLPRDLRIGRCYLPQEWLDEYGLTAEALLQAGNSQSAQGLLRQGIDQALDYYAAGAEYVLAIPANCVRLRLAALWPLMIGLETLQQLASAPNWLDKDTVVKVERSWVYGMLWRSLWCVRSDVLLRCWIEELKPSLN